MKVIGTKQEIEWLIESITNCCVGCPFFKDCNRQALMESVREEGKCQESCLEYLKKKMEIEIIQIPQDIDAKC